MGEKETTKTEQDYLKTDYDLQLEETGKPITKQLLWERKLLDFSLRNNLLNTRLGRRVVPFISFGIEHLEDHLQNNEDYMIIPSPGKKIDPNEEGMYNSRHQAAGYQEFVSEMIKSNKIVSYLTEAELQNALTYVYRTARTSLEENGANSLFLALGMLRWFETNKSEQPRYAPILLLPVDIVRRSGNKYVIRKRDEDIILNFTLVELLKQYFLINLDSLKELPKDESGVDVIKIFTYIRQAIEDQKRWNVLEESMLGLFSFNKFVMWNDIHSNADKLTDNAIIASLIENCNKLEASEEAVDARIIDKMNSPMDFSIPLDVDSSQMEAIVESGRGRTFILHGPPGTGKSQTITNMIANALYQGRRVLFVAEKMAALSVVQSRLEKIGLAPFCLELHSNKATKKHFLEQMDRVLNITKIREPADYAAKAQELFTERKNLISYMEALHKKDSNGLSLYDCISEYLAIEQNEIQDDLPDKSELTADFITVCREQIAPLGTILNIVGIPEHHPLFGLEPINNRLETTDAIKKLLQEFRETFADYTQTLAEYSNDMLQIDLKARKREWQDIQVKWFLPRYFSKKKFLKGFKGYGQVNASNIEEVFALVNHYQQHQEIYQNPTSYQGANDSTILDLYCQLTALKEQLDSKTNKENPIEVMATSMNKWLEGYPQMKDWYLWTNKKRELCQMNLQPVVALLEKGEKPQEVIPAFLKAIFHRLITVAIDDDEQLRSFNGQVFRQEIDLYKQNTLRFQELSK